VLATPPHPSGLVSSPFPPLKYFFFLCLQRWHGWTWSIFFPFFSFLPTSASRFREAFSDSKWGLLISYVGFACDLPSARPEAVSLTLYAVGPVILPFPLGNKGGVFGVTHPRFPLRPSPFESFPPPRFGFPVAP